MLRMTQVSLVSSVRSALALGQSSMLHIGDVAQAAAGLRHNALT